MVLFNTFRAWAQAQDRSAGDRAVAGLADLLRDGTSEEKLTRLRGEGDTIWFGLHPEGVLVPVHHLHVHGGTRVQPDVSIWALVGDGPSAYPIKLSVADVAHYQDVTAVASWTNVVNLDSEEALTAAPAGANDVPMPDLLPLPPSLACALLDEPDRRPWQLVRPLRSAVSAYDNAKADADPAMKDDLHVRFSARWLWAAHHGRIRSIRLTPSTSPAVTGWAKSIHDQHITGPGMAAGGAAAAAAAAAPGGGSGGGVGGPAVGLGGGAAGAALVAVMTELKDEVKMGRLSKELSAAKSKPGLASFPSSVQQTIKFASQTVTRTGAIRGSVPASANEFFSASTASHAALALQSFTLHCKYHVPAQNKEGLATRLHKGGLKWRSNGVPSGLSIFACGPGDVMANNGSEEAISMSLAASEGVGLTEEQQKTLLKQDLAYPRTVEAAKKQIALFAAILLMLFGQSEVQMFIDLWVDHIRENEEAYETLTAMDGEFFLKMFYFLDKAVQVFLGHCERQTSRDKVPDEIFECQSFKRQILLHQCPFNMPAQFTDPAEQPAPVDEGSPLKKKRKASGRTKVENKNSVETLIVNQNNFQNKYGRHGAHYESRPNIRNTKFCVTFHLLGHCYTDCPEIASHVKLNATEEGQVKGYITKCQS